MNANARHREGQNLYRRDGRERRVRREGDGATTKTKTTRRRYSVAEPQPKTKIHNGGTETRRRSKPISTTEDTRSRATTKTILYHRGHEGTRREPKPKLTAEGAKQAQRAQSRTEAIKFAQKTKKFA